MHWRSQATFEHNLGKLESPLTKAAPILILALMCKQFCWEIWIFNVTLLLMVASGAAVSNKSYTNLKPLNRTTCKCPSIRDSFRSIRPWGSFKQISAFCHQSPLRFVRSHTFTAHYNRPGGGIHFVYAAISCFILSFRENEGNWRCTWTQENIWSAATIKWWRIRIAWHYFVAYFSALSAHHQFLQP